ncbi:hypothetical protein ERS140147_00026 [Staphylococcus schweitzeri]|uniref:Uncharacterized protein n=1 Tax=Staphylococcus schweitzeri TaxID=1654388 RepID=A0A077UDY8_9STAP|nr:hypothetical protein ERS140147_00026 [Staphylococcus schweitzeri]
MRIKKGRILIDAVIFYAKKRKKFIKSVVYHV